VIRELRIRNFAIIEEIDVEFHPGLNVLTGETGAGKSIIVEALSLLLGRKAGGEVVRTGASRAEVEALFEEGNEEIVLRREIYPEGKSRAFYQGRGVPVGFLREIGPSLFEIHSQLEYGWILKESNQLDALDRYGGEVIRALLGEYKKLYEDYLSKKEELKRLEVDSRELERRREELSFYLDEVQRACLREGEEEELLEKRKKLLNLEELKLHLKGALSIVEGEGWGGGLIDKISELKKMVGKAADYERDLSKFLGDLESMLVSLKELESELSKRLELLNLPEESLDEIEGRLSLIRRLKRKHGVESVSELLRLASSWKRDLGLLERVDDKIRLLKEEVERLYVELHSLGVRLSEERKACALRLEEEVRRVLKKLAMGEIVFKIEIGERELGPLGMDSVRFVMAPSPGEELRGISDVASGGEISRLSFALKCAISRSYGVPTLIFDEIDVGVGGEVANMLGEEIKKLSRERQVICITHLASIASKADYHYFVDKVLEEGRVKTRIRLLDEEGRLKEIARMLSGRVSDIALKHAKEILEGGHR